MNNKKIHQDFLQGEELPANILPTGIAWKDMQQRLDKEQPDKGGLLTNDPGKDKAIRSRIVKGTALLLLLLLTGLVIQQVNNKGERENTLQAHTGEERINSKKSVDDTALSNQTSNSLENEKYERNENRNLRAGNDLSKKDNNISLSKNNTKTAIAIDKKDNKKNRDGSFNKKLKSNYSSNKNNEGISKTMKRPTARIQSKDGEINISQDNATTKTLKKGDEITSFVLKDSITGDLSSMTNTDKKKQDSLQKTNVTTTQPEPQEKKRTEIQWGLQWTLQLPTGNADKYFTGPTTASQPYRILLPGIWLNFRIGRSVFETEVNPFASTILPAKSFGTFATSTTNIDTIITTTEMKTLRKMFGLSATFGYAYNISGNWWFGTSIQGYWWRKGIASTKGEEVKQVIGSSLQTRRSFSNTYSIPPIEKDYFTKLQVINSLELAYRINSSTAMLRIGVTPLPFSKKEGPGNPFRAELVFKLALFDKKKSGSGYAP